MTDNQRISIRSQLLAEIEQAEDDFACRREQALRLAREFRQVAEIAEHNAMAIPSAEDCLAGPSLSQQLPEQTYKSVLDYPATISLLSEVRKARQKVHDLRQRKSLMWNRGSVNTI